jgi:hypothetical protein
LAFSDTPYGKDTVYIMVEKGREEGAGVWVARVVEQGAEEVREL